MSDMQTIVQRMLAGQPLDESLEELASRDPRMALLSRLAARRSETEAVVARDDEESLHARLVELTAEVDQLRERTRDCAAALGACPRCWGDDAGCPYCRGRGRPGFSAPDERAFRALVAPAVHTYRVLRGGRSARTDNTDRTIDGGNRELP